MHVSRMLLLLSSCCSLKSFVATLFLLRLNKGKHEKIASFQLHNSRKRRTGSDTVCAINREELSIS